MNDEGEADDPFVVVVDISYLECHICKESEARSIGAIICSEVDRSDWYGDTALIAFPLPRYLGPPA